MHRDGEGNITKEISPNAYDSRTNDGAGIEYIYDDYDRAVRVCYPDGGILRRWYDPAGNLVKTCSPTQYDPASDSGAGYTYEYDSMGRLIQAAAPDGTVLRRYVYDLHGNLTKLIRADWMRTGETDEARTGELYAYNRLGWLMESRIPVSVQDDGEVLYMDKFTPDGQCSADRGEHKKLASYLRTKQNHGGVLTPSEERILRQIDDYTRAGKSGKPSPSHYISENGPGYVYMTSFHDIGENPYIHDQRHHTNQGAAYNDVIPYPDGLCIELYGNAFRDKNSWHYKAHQSLEKFWNDYRKGGSRYRDKPTNGQYNRALYDSMVFAGFTNDEAAYIAFRAYDQQKSYGLNITDKVPNVPNRMPQKTRRNNGIKIRFYRKGNKLQLVCKLW